nr:GMC oxidoreductase [Devosia sp.]
MAAPALRAITETEMPPSAEAQSDGELLDYFRANSGSIYHLCGTARMGPGAGDSVVDPATARPWHCWPARHRRVGLPQYHRRKHPRPDDDGRRTWRRACSSTLKLTIAVSGSGPRPSPALRVSYQKPI